MLANSTSLRGVEDLGRAVAVVDVPVEHEHAAEAHFGDRRGGRDGDVVEQAEAHRARPLGVVAGRAHGAEARLRFAREQRPRPARRRRPRHAVAALKEASADERVGVDRPAPGGAQLPDRAHVLGGVDELELLL